MNQPYRLRAPGGLLVDLVPFGGIENPEGQVSFPAQLTQVMVTLGFTEAHAHALLIEIDDVGPIRVNSLAGMSLLKLLAWRDRREARDAEDLGFLIREYYGLLGEDVYLQHADLFDVEDFDTRTASARILGRDAGAIASGSKPLQTAISAILEEQLDERRKSSPLATAMGERHVKGHDVRIRCLSSYLLGFEERADNQS